MEYKNLKEIVEEQESLVLQKTKYETALNEAKKSKKHGTKHCKGYWNPIIDTYKNIIDEYKNKINKLNYTISELNSFPKEIFIPFLLECININEEENYVYRNIIISQTSHLTNEFFPSFMPYDIIFPERILEEEKKIEQTFYVSVLHMAYKDLFEQNDCNYIMMHTRPYIELLTPNFTLIATFEKFPYLQDVATNLIERKLKEPNKSNKDILKEELEEQKEIQKKKLKN